MAYNIKQKFLNPTDAGVEIAIDSSTRKISDSYSSQYLTSGIENPNPNASTNANSYYSLSFQYNGNSSLMVFLSGKGKINQTVARNLQKGTHTICFKSENDYSAINFESVEDLPKESVSNVEITLLDAANALAEEKAKRIGIQGPTGTPLCINGEKILIGRSGLYEIDYPSFTISFVARLDNGDSPVYLDYVKKED